MRYLAGFSIALAALATAACRGDDGAASSKTTEAAPAPAAVASAEQTAAPEAAGTTGRHRDQPDWVPAEYKSGRGRWRDPGVYIDGEAAGFIWFGELPVALEPVFLEYETDVEFHRDKGGPQSKTVLARRYRIAEYLEHLGVDLRKVKEVHLYGGVGKVMRVTGAQIRKFRDEFTFGFGGETFGKPIPYTPPKLTLNSYFDRISGISVYVSKKPPKVVDGDGLKLDGEWVEGVPYFGEPLRGGIRVYKDDRLATIFKRRKLADATELADKTADGEIRWNLFSVLKDSGVQTDDIVEAAIIFDERRTGRLTREQLEGLYFTANPQASGEILLGDDKVPAQGLAFHTEPIPQRIAAMHEALANED